MPPELLFEICSLVRGPLQHRLVWKPIDSPQLAHVLLRNITRQARRPRHARLIQYLIVIILTSLAACSRSRRNTASSGRASNYIHDGSVAHATPSLHLESVVRRASPLLDIGGSGCLNLTRTQAAVPQTDWVDNCAVGLLLGLH